MPNEIEKMFRSLENEYNQVLKSVVHKCLSNSNGTSAAYVFHDIKLSKKKSGLVVPEDMRPALTVVTEPVWTTLTVPEGWKHPGDTDVDVIDDYIDDFEDLYDEVQEALEELAPEYSVYTYYLETEAGQICKAVKLFTKGEDVASGSDGWRIPYTLGEYKYYDMDKVIEKIEERKSYGKNFSIVVVSEGAYPKGGSISVKDTREGGKGVINIQLGGAGDLVAKEIEARTGITARNTTLGYMQRGGSPTASDRVLSTKYGAKAMELAMEGKFNVLTVLKNGRLDCVSLEDVVGENKEVGAVAGGTKESNMKVVTMDDDLVKTARAIGISLGD